MADGAGVINKQTGESRIDGREGLTIGSDRSHLQAALVGISREQTRPSPASPRTGKSLRDTALAAQAASHHVVATSEIPIVSPAGQFEPSALSGREAIFGSRTQTAKAQEEKKGFWGNLWESTKSFVSGAADVAVGITKGVTELGRLVLVEGAPKLVTKESWSGVGSALNWVGEKLTDPSTWKAAGELWWKGVTLGPRAIAYAITHPIEALKKTGTFLKSMSDGLGLTDVCVGVGRLCTGDFGGAAQAFKGAGTAFLEFTGIGDAWGALKHAGLALYCLGTGDKMGAAAHLGQAVMHGAFAAMSIGSIAATVATGGAAAGAVVGVMLLRQSFKSAAKQVLKTAAKEFLEQAGKEAGEQLVKSVAKEVGQETLERTARQSVETGSIKVLADVLGKADAAKLLDSATPQALREQLLERASREMTPSHFEKAFKEIGADSTNKLMKDAGVAKKAEDLVFELLTDARRVSKKELAQRLERQGFDPKRARAAAEEAKKALGDQHGPFFSEHTPFDRNLWQRDFDSWKDAAERRMNAIDKEMAHTLTEQMKKPLAEMLVEQQREVFLREIRSTLLGQSDTPLSKTLGSVMEKQAKAQGKSVSGLVEEYAERSWKGYREGIEEAVEAAVKEGVENGIKRFRGILKKTPIPPSQTSIASIKGLGGRESVKHSGNVEHASESDRKEAEVERVSAHRAVTSRMRHEGGKTYRDVLVQKHGEDRWDLESTTELGPDESLRAKGKQDTSRSS